MAPSGPSASARLLQLEANGPDIGGLLSPGPRGLLGPASAPVTLASLPGDATRPSARPPPPPCCEARDPDLESAAWNWRLVPLLGDPGWERKAPGATGLPAPLPSLPPPLVAAAGPDTAAAASAAALAAPHMASIVAAGCKGDDKGDPPEMGAPGSRPGIPVATRLGAWSEEGGLGWPRTTRGRLMDCRLCLWGSSGGIAVMGVPSVLVEDGR